MNFRVLSSVRCLLASSGFAVTTIMIPASAAEIGGAHLYQRDCLACHQADGAGLPGMAPPLRSDSLKRLGSRAGVYVASVLLNGLSGVDLDGGFYPGPMPAWAALTDDELAALANHVLELNGLTPTLTATQIVELRRHPVGKAQLQGLRNSP